MPTVSVIVPVYNVEEYLPRCIDSILNQTYRDFELILVDDGSPDNCGTICDEYAAKDLRIRVIHKKNGGASSTRNVGLDIAVGKYIMFCDSDDWTHPTWIETLHSSADRSPDMCIVSNIWCVTGENEECTPIGDTFPSSDAQNYYTIWKNGVSAYTPNKIYRADIIEANQLRFDTSIKLSEDLAFNLKYQTYIKQLHPNSSNIYLYVSKPLYFYRMNTSGTTRRYRPDLMLENLFPFRIRIPYIEKDYIGEYCDIWLYKFIHMFENVFDKRCKMSFVQKLQYNQKMMNSEEFKYCISHCSGKKESPLALRILKTSNYYLYWLFDRLYKLKRKIGGNQK